MATEFLKKHLQGYKEKGNYCFGKHVGSVRSLVDSFMAVTNTAFRRVSKHQRGRSKRLKQDSCKRLWFSHTNSALPIPFNGYVFEILTSEMWSCSIEADIKISEEKKLSKKRSLPSSVKCPAVIQVRTVKVYPSFTVKNVDSDNKKEQENIKCIVLKKLECGEQLPSQVVSYFRFPLDGAHLNHAPSRDQIVSHRMDRKIAKKIKEFAINGLHDVDELQSRLFEYVRDVMFVHLDDHEKPHHHNTRYFPCKRVIYNHMVAALGPLKKTYVDAAKSIQPLPVEVDIVREPAPAARFEDGIGLVAIHAGAGYHSDAKWPAYRRLCDEACWYAMTCIKEGGTAGEAVVIAVKVLEDSDLTNAGYGSSLTEVGSAECDAGVMDTSSGDDGRPRYGSVTGVSRVKNPICAAYMVAKRQAMEPSLSLGRVPPCVISGQGAEQWSRAHGVEMCEKDDLISESSRRSWEKYNQRLLEHLRKNNKENDNEDSSHRLDTVGAVAVDVNGRVASAVSSGGLWMKLPGRIGQAAMFGCGNWAECGVGSKPSIAVATTGCGEQLMYTTMARKCASNLLTSDQPYDAVRDTLLRDFLSSPILNDDEDKLAGLLVLHQSQDGVDVTTEVVWGHTTSSMLVAHMTSRDNKPEVVMSRLPENATSGHSVSVSGTWIKVAMETTCTRNDHGPCEVPPITGQHVTNDPALQLDGRWDDDDISLIYVTSDVDGLPMERCYVTLSSDYDRKIDKEFELKIDERWNERLRHNNRLFNASKFRIDSFSYDGETLELRLGITYYRDYMETNWSRDIEKLCHKGQCDYGNPQAYLADPLGVAGVILTSDGQCVFQRRNQWVAEGAGQLDVPGGHPEPSEVTNQDITADVDISRLTSDDVIKEIFTSQLKEVNNEVNIPLEKMGEPRLLGLARNRLSGGRPVCYFLIRCSLSSNQIKALYEMGGAETDESTELLFKQSKELIGLRQRSPEFWNDLCPNGKAAVSLYAMVMDRKQEASISACGGASR